MIYLDTRINIPQKQNNFKVKMSDLTEKKKGSFYVSSSDAMTSYGKLLVNFSGNEVNTGAVFFCGSNKETHKKIDIEAEKQKLLSLINKNLETGMSDTQDSDINTFFAYMKHILSGILKFETKKKQLEERFDALNKNNTLNNQQKLNEINIIRREYTKLKKEKQELLNSKINNGHSSERTYDRRIQDEKIDYLLMNKFKTAVLDDNFNLNKIFQDYYSGLNDVKTIAELNEKYPKIKTPPRPEDIITKKVTDILTKDFYQQYNIYKNNSQEQADEFLSSRISEMFLPLSKKYNVKHDELLQKISSPIKNAVIEINKNYNAGKLSIAENCKYKQPQVSELDIKMLLTDFDDFVISTIKKQYLNMQRTDDIILPEFAVAPKNLKGTSYKFEKISEKVKEILKKAAVIHTAQRDYEHFDNKQLTDRLVFFEEKETGENDIILDNLIDFATCDLTNEDKETLIPFLKIMDKVIDEEITPEAAETEILNKKLMPISVKKRDEEEKLKAEAELKERQKKNAQLNKMKKDFDNVINILYKNELSAAGNCCEKYRPNSHSSEKDLKDATYLMDMISRSINSDNEIQEKNKLGLNILRWDEFTLAKKNDTPKELLSKAIEFGTDSNGILDECKAGQYLANYKIILNPSAAESKFYPREVLDTIMKRTHNNIDKAVKYLCIYDRYLELDEDKKTHLVNFLEYFNIKDFVEKTMLENIIMNDYINMDTRTVVKVNNREINAVIAPTAKEAINEKYKFPNSIVFLKKFEEALSKVAYKNGEAGIKTLTGNNAKLKYKMELKITGASDRLVSEGNDYWFDKYLEDGFHQN